MKRFWRGAACAFACMIAGCGGDDDNDGSAEPPTAQFEAEVRWTQYGLPHIKANDYAGLGYGYGYAVARDQLCLLADRVRTLRGERSAEFGPEDTALVGFLPLSNLDSDLFYRVQLSDEEVDAAWQDLSADARALAEGYAAGFNRYVNDMSPGSRDAACEGRAPQAMRASDVLRATMQVGTLWKAFLVAPFAAASQWDALVAADTPMPAAVPRPDQQMASNAWAFGGEATGTTAAIMVANPHTQWQDHWLLMHPMHLTIPGEIDVMGADFIGLPVPLSGFTRDIAWSIEAPSTVTYPLPVALDVREGAQPSYVVDGDTLAFERREIVIEVRQMDGSVRPETFALPYSHWGPVYRLPTGWHAVTDPNVANARGIDQMLAVAKARDIVEFEQAVAGHRGITAHLIAGDRHGNAMYIESGRLLDVDDATLRDCAAPGAEGEGVPAALDGGRSECALRDDQGRARLAPAERIPALATRGVVQNANDNYTHAIVGERFDEYSILLGSPTVRPNARTRMSQRQIQEYLAGGGRVGVEEAIGIVYDNRNLAAETMLDDILAVCGDAAADADAQQACGILSGWDRRHDPDSRGALLFHELWPRVMAINDLYEEPYDASQPFRELPISRSPTVSEQIAAALGETVGALGALGLRGDEPWGSMLARETPQGRVPLHGGSGDQGVLNVLDGGALGPQGYDDILSGTAYVHVVTWQPGREEPLARMVIANGVSADAPHREDQLSVFGGKQLYEPPFTDAQIAADPALEALTLSE